MGSFAQSEVLTKDFFCRRLHEEKS
eukprot:COSAG01_NODE_31063_length_604_cov_1.332673_1_plen_24_part_10